MFLRRPSCTESNGRFRRHNAPCLPGSRLQANLSHELNQDLTSSLDQSCGDQVPTAASRLRNFFRNLFAHRERRKQTTDNIAAQDIGLKAAMSPPSGEAVANPTQERMGSRPSHELMKLDDSMECPPLRTLKRKRVSVAPLAVAPSAELLSKTIDADMDSFFCSSESAESFRYAKRGKVCPLQHPIVKQIPSLTSAKPIADVGLSRGAKLPQKINATESRPTFDQPLRRMRTIAPAQRVLRPKVSEVPKKKKELQRKDSGTRTVGNQKGSKILRVQPSQSGTLTTSTTAESGPDESPSQFARTPVQEDPPISPSSLAIQKHWELVNRNFGQEVAYSELRLMLNGQLKSYYSEAFLRLKSKEANDRLVDPNYFKYFGERVTPLTRSACTQWMVYLQRKIPSPLSPFTLHIAINILDRFLSYEGQQKNSRKNWKPASLVLMGQVEDNLHTIAASCLSMASKLEDVWPIDLKDVCFLGGHRSMCAKDICSWEFRILNALDWNLDGPTVLDFLLEYIMRGGFSTRDSHTQDWHPTQPTAAGKSAYEAASIYLCEVVLMHPLSLQHPAHLVAGACLLVTITYIQGKDRRVANLPKAVLACLGKDKEQLKEVATRVCAIFEEHELGLSPDIPSFSKDVSAKHKDSSKYLRLKYSNWKVLYNK